MREQQEQKRQTIAHKEQKKREMNEAQRRAEIERRMHPRTAEDFQLLYNELEGMSHCYDVVEYCMKYCLTCTAWRLQETKRINNMGLPEEQRMAALAQLLYKQTKLLQTIDRLKLSAGQENKDERIQRQLELVWIVLSSFYLFTLDVRSQTMADE